MLSTMVGANSAVLTDVDFVGYTVVAGIGIAANETDNINTFGGNVKLSSADPNVNSVLAGNTVDNAVLLVGRCQCHGPIYVDDNDRHSSPVARCTAQPRAWPLPTLRQPPTIRHLWGRLLSFGLVALMTSTPGPPVSVNDYDFNHDRRKRHNRGGPGNRLRRRHHYRQHLYAVAEREDHRSHSLRHQYFRPGHFHPKRPSPVHRQRQTRARSHPGRLSSSGRQKLKVTDRYTTDTMSGVIAGTTTNLNTNGKGTLVLAGSNTYTGTTNITEGVLNIQNPFAQRQRLIEPRGR